MGLFLVIIEAGQGDSACLRLLEGNSKMREYRLFFATLFAGLALLLVLTLQSNHQAAAYDDPVFLPLSTSSSVGFASLGGPDSSGYKYADSDESWVPDYSWEDISGTGTQVVTFTPTTDDGYSAPIPIGFDFPFYENTYNELYVGTNGYISFGEGSKKVPTAPFPNDLDPNNAIFAFGADMVVDGSTGVYVEEKDSPKRFIVQFDNLDSYLSPGSLSSFQIILYENGNVRLQYQSVGTTPRAVGLENADGSIGMSYPPENVKNSFSIMFYSPNQTCFANLNDSGVYHSVQEAVNAANNGDTIKVAGQCTGVGHTSGVTQTVYIDKDITLSGGYTITNWLTPDPVNIPSILDAEGNGRVIYIEDGATPTIEGLNLVNGNANGLGGGVDGKDAGGGLYVVTTTVTLKNNVIHDNMAELGAGIYASNSNSSIEDTTVRDNFATEDGGGYYLNQSPVDIAGGLISGNEAVNGGGLYITDTLVALNKPLVVGNTATDNGGGIYFNKSNPTILGLNVRSNTAMGDGGGIYLDQSDIRLRNAILAKNNAHGSGAAVFVFGSSPTFVYNTIADNSGGDGSGISVVEDGSVQSTVLMTNTIFSNHGTGITVATTNTATLAHTLWHANTTRTDGGGTIVSTNEYDGNPLFLDPGNGDYHIDEKSDAIGIGIDVGITEDIDRHPRPSLGIDNFDVGADEFPIAVQVHKEVAPNPVYAGDDLTYTVYVTNVGDIDVTAIITDPMPTGVLPTGELSATKDVLSPGIMWTQEFKVTAEQGFDGGIDNTAQILLSDGITSIYTETSVSSSIILPSVQFNNANYGADEGDGYATITVERVGNLDGMVTVEYAVNETVGTATKDVDYTAVSGRLTFKDGETTQTFIVPIIEDSELEPSSGETVRLELSNATGNAKVGRDKATLAIRDNDPLPAGVLEFEVDTFEVDENVASGEATITVKRLVGDTGMVTVDYTTSDGTATAGSDYDVASGTIVFADGDSEETFTVPIANDDDSEGSESVHLTLSNPMHGAQLGSQTSSILVIKDDDITPHGVLQFESITFAGQEADTIQEAIVRVERLGGDSGAVSVPVNTSDGSAEAARNDYNPSPNPMTVSFADGDTTTKEVRISILPDSEVEGSEFLNIHLGLATGGAITGSQRDSVVVIQDDDNAPAGVIEFEPIYSTSEGAGSIDVTVHRVAGSDGLVTAHVFTTDDTATDGDDYLSVDETVTFADGVTSKTVSIPIREDEVAEGTETINLTVDTPTNGAVIGSQDQATIRIDDNDMDDSGVVQFDQTSFNTNEATGAVSVEVERVGGTSGEVSVQLTSADDTAISGSDFMAVSQIVKLNDGETSKTINLSNIIDDTLLEGTEFFYLNLTDLGGGAIVGSQDQAIVFINDDEQFTSGVLEFEEPTYVRNETGGSFTIKILRMGGSSGMVEVDVASANDSATAGSDYNGLNNTVRFNDGEIEKTISVDILDDDLVEGSEIFSLALSGPTGGAELGSQQTTSVVINDDDTIDHGVIEFDEVSYQFSETAGTVNLTLRRVGGDAGNVSVHLSTVDDTATAGDDYQAVDTTVNFADGQASKTVPIMLLDDDLVEGSEIFNVRIDTPMGGAELGAWQNVAFVIQDDETVSNGVLEFSAPSYSQVEDNTTVDITIDRVAGDQGNVTVDVRTVDGTATGGSDYGSLNETVTFLDGQISKTVSVPILEDDISEGSETLTLELSNVTGGANLGSQNTTVLYIDDDDTEPEGTLKFSQSSYTVDEGGTVTLTVERVGSTSGVATVDINTNDDTASAGSDYPPTNTTISFPDGSASQTISLTLPQDTLEEGSETFEVVLSNATGGRIGIPSQTTIIINDDDAVAPSVVQFEDSLFSVGENGGQAQVTVSRSGSTAEDVSVRVYTTNDTAISGSDYVGIDTTRTIASGSVSTTFSIDITNDDELEGSELFGLHVVIASGKATLGTRSTSAVVIEDDDQSPAGVVQFSLPSYMEREGNSAVVTVERVGGSGGMVTVDVATSNGTALAGSDYDSTSTTLVFADGEVSKTFPVTLTSDTEVEGSETVNLALSKPTGGVSLASLKQATLFIEDTIPPESPGVLQFGAPEFIGNEGGAVSIVVERIGGSRGAATVDIASSDGIALAGSDYVAINRTLSFADGESSKTISMTLSPDDQVEGSETFNLALSNVTGAVLGSQKNAVVIVEDTTPGGAPGVIQLTHTSYSGNEGGTVTIMLERVGGSKGSATIDIDSSDDTALAGSDYDAVNQTVTFVDGQTTATITVNLSPDSEVEGSETFNIVLGNETGADLGSQKTAVVVIEDDDTESVGIFQFTDSIFFTEEGSRQASIKIERIGGTYGEFSVGMRAEDLTAFDGEDYQSLDITVPFSDGQKIKVVDIPIKDDSKVEEAERVSLTLYEPSSSPNTKIGSQRTATLVIQDNDSATPGIFQFTDSSFQVGEDEGSIPIMMVQRIGGNTGVVTLTVRTEDGSAKVKEDYDRVTSLLVFEHGETTKPITITVNDDEKAEGSEYFRLFLDQAVSEVGVANLGRSMTTLFINDNDEGISGVLQFSQNSLPVSEDDGKAIVQVQRVGGTSGEVSVNIASIPGKALPNQDYRPVNEKLTFADGEDTKDFKVTILPDMVIEGSEQFKLEIRGATGGDATVGSQNQITIFIQDVINPGKFEFEKGSYTFEESYGMVPIYVKRTEGTVGTVTVDFSTKSGSAKATKDFQSTSGRLTFLDGEDSQSFFVPIINDRDDDDNQVLYLELSNPTGGSFVVSKTATLTIKDDDAAGELHFTQDYRVVNEGDGKISIDVERVNGSAGIVGAGFTISGGTADDYTITQDEVLFLDGEKSGNIEFVLDDNETFETTRTLKLKLNSPTGGATLGDPQEITIDIKDNDEILNPGVLEFTQSSYIAKEGDGETTIDVRRDPSAGRVFVSYETEAKSAEPNVDYTSTNGDLKFDDGQSHDEFTILILDDKEYEPVSKTVTLRLLNPDGGAKLGKRTEATLYIIDNDDPPGTIQFQRDVYTFDRDKDDKAELKVHHSGARDELVTVKFDIRPIATSSSTPSGYYEDQSGYVTFPRGANDSFINISIPDENIDGITETLEITLNEVMEGRATLGEPSTTLLHITTPGRIQFMKSEYTCKESDEFIEIPVRRVSGSLGPAEVDVDIDVSGEMTVEGKDFRIEDEDTHLSFASGETEKMLTIELVDDEESESPERVKLRLRPPEGAGIGDITETELIIEDDDDIVIEFSKTDISKLFDEDEKDKKKVVINVHRRGDPSEVATVMYKTEDNTAIDGEHYDAQKGETLTFEKGQTNAQISIDLLPIEEEQRPLIKVFSVTLYNQSENVLLNGDKDSAQVTLSYPVKPYLPAQFIAGTYEINEEDGGGYIELKRTEPHKKDREEGVCLKVEGAPYVDYDSYWEPVIIKKGEISATHKIKIVPNDEPEGYKYLIVTLSPLILDENGQCTDAEEGKNPASINTFVSMSRSLARVRAAQMTNAPADHKDEPFEQYKAIVVVKDSLYYESNIVGFAGPSYKIREEVEEGQVEVTLFRTTDKGDASVLVTSYGDTANSGYDFGDVAEPVYFDDGGETKKSIFVPIIDDKEPEGDETFYLKISEPEGTEISESNRHYEVTILDNDKFTGGIIQFVEVRDSVGEEDGSKTVKVERVSDLTGEVSVSYEVVDPDVSGATAKEDFDFKIDDDKTLTFKNGEKEKEFEVKIEDDDDLEGDERFYLKLKPNNNSGLGMIGSRDELEIKIEDDDTGPPPIDSVLQFSYPSYKVWEGKEEGVDIRIERVGGDHDQELTVRLSSDGQGGATEDKDYVAPDGLITFESGKSYVDFTIQINDDEEEDPGERIKLTLSEPGDGAQLGSQRQATVIIRDNDTQYHSSEGTIEFLYDDYDVGEDDGSVDINVIRTGDISKTATVHYETFGSGDAATEDIDFKSTSGDLRFAPGEYIASFTIEIYDDDEVEGNGVVNLKLSSLEGSEVPLGTKREATLIIVEDDYPSGGIIEFPTKKQSFEEGTKPAPITVYRNGGRKGTVNVGYKIGRDGSATEGEDYTMDSTPPYTLTFDPGVDSLPIEIDIEEDEEAEGTESLSLFITGLDPEDENNDVVLGDRDWASVDIIDNDGPKGGIIEFSKDVYDVREGEPFEKVFVERLGRSSGDVIVRYMVIDGTATRGEDYHTENYTSSGTLRFEDGSNDDGSNKKLPFYVYIDDDDIADGDETALLVLMEPTIAGEQTDEDDKPTVVLGTRNVAILKIHDDEPASVEFTQDKYHVYEGYEQTAPITIAIKPDNYSETARQTQTVRVDVRTVEYDDRGPEMADTNDYEPFKDTITITPSMTQASFQIPIKNDDLDDEGDELVFLELSSLDPEPDIPEMALSGRTSATLVIHESLPRPEGMLLELFADKEYVQLGYDYHLEEEDSYNTRLLFVVTARLSNDKGGYYLSEQPLVLKTNVHTFCKDGKDLGQETEQKTDEGGEVKIGICIPGEEESGMQNVSGSVAMMQDIDISAWLKNKQDYVMDTVTVATLRGIHFPFLDNINGSNLRPDATVTLSEEPIIENEPSQLFVSVEKVFRFQEPEPVANSKVELDFEGKCQATPSTVTTDSKGKAETTITCSKGGEVPISIIEIENDMYANVTPTSLYVVAMDTFKPSIEPNSTMEAKVGEERTFKVKATGTYTDGRTFPIPGQSVEFSLSAPLDGFQPGPMITPKTAVTDKNGEATATVTNPGLWVGSATLRAVAGANTKVQELKITAVGECPEDENAGKYGNDCQSADGVKNIPWDVACRGTFENDNGSHGTIQDTTVYRDQYRIELKKESDVIITLSNDTKDGKSKYAMRLERWHQPGCSEIPPSPAPLPDNNEEYETHKQIIANNLSAGTYFINVAAREFSNDNKDNDNYILSVRVQ